MARKLVSLSFDKIFYYTQVKIFKLHRVEWFGVSPLLMRPSGLNERACDRFSKNPEGVLIFHGMGAGFLF